MAGNRGRLGAVARRLIGVSLALALVAAFAPGAGADTKAELDAAKARLTQIGREVDAQHAVLARLQAEANALAEKVSVEQGRLNEIVQELIRTREALAQARERYEELRARLDERAREAYMGGLGSNLEFLLGATSLADLSDRMEYVDALSQTDSDLANEVQNRRNELAAQEAKEESLKVQQAEVVNGLREEQAALNASFDEQRAILADIEAKRAEAEELVKKLGRQYKRELAAMFGGKIGDGPIQICPVAQPHAYGDGFGAPRYGGGYHLHAGVDIFAPYGTPIYAPFDGNAVNSSNGLGGLAVTVYGEFGYVYNAHLSRAGNLGQVSVGEVIGYVGDSGDAQGTSPHDHFEWHPNSIPSGWPASSYGYSVIGDAVNPYPLLTQVC